MTSAGVDDPYRGGVDVVVVGGNRCYGYCWVEGAVESCGEETIMLLLRHKRAGKWEKITPHQISGPDHLCEIHVVDR